jgi:hypothetical protein
LPTEPLSARSRQEIHCEDGAVASDVEDWRGLYHAVKPALRVRPVVTGSRKAWMTRGYGMGRVGIFLLAGLSSVGTGWVGSAWAEPVAPLSPAQVMLFESNHLKAISHPVQLDYAFEHRGGSGDFQDKITATIQKIHENGRKDVAVGFLTGDHHRNFPGVTEFNGNPLLMFFLENDVIEMREATGGPDSYFRNRIRNAFVDGAETHPTEITLDGQKQSATEIVIAPFRKDPHLDRFPAFGDKTYHFVLSDAVPGTIYRISTEVTAAPEGGQNGAQKQKVFEESMTYAGEHDAAP